MIVHHKDVTYRLGKSVRLSRVLAGIGDEIDLKCNSREAVAFVMMYMQSCEDAEIEAPPIPVTEPLAVVFAIEFDVFGCLINTADPPGTLAFIDKIMEIVDLLELHVLRDKLAAIAAGLAVVILKD